MEIILILYVIMMLVTYYLDRRLSKKIFRLERGWSDVLISFITSIAWPVFIIPLCIIINTRKPPKWL